MHASGVRLISLRNRRRLFLQQPILNSAMLFLPKLRWSPATARLHFPVCPNRSKDNGGTGKATCGTSSAASLRCAHSFVCLHACIYPRTSRGVWLSGVVQADRWAPSIRNQERTSEPDVCTHNICSNFATCKTELTDFLLALPLGDNQERHYWLGLPHMQARSKMEGAFQVQTSVEIQLLV